MTVERAARTAARSIRRTPETVVKAAGQAIAKELNRLAKQEVGADQKMSNLRNVRIGAKVTVTRWGRGAIADVEPSTPRARAPWRWLTDGTKDHTVPRANRRRQRPVPPRLQVQGEWRTGPWRVSGVRAKGLWWKAERTAKAQQAAVDAFSEEMRRG